MTWLARSNCPAAARRCSGLGGGRMEASLLAIGVLAGGPQASGRRAATRGPGAAPPLRTDHQVTTGGRSVKKEGAAASRSRDRQAPGKLHRSLTVAAATFLLGAVSR